MMRRAVAPRASTAPAVQLMSLLAFVTSSTVKRTRGDFSDCVLQCVLTRISVRLWLEKKIQFQSQSFDCIWETNWWRIIPKEYQILQRRDCKSWYGTKKVGEMRFLEHHVSPSTKEKNTLCIWCSNEENGRGRIYYVICLDIFLAWECISLWVQYPMYVVLRLMYS